jgi:hypothetical protein
MTAEVAKKATMAATLSDSLTHNERIGGAKTAMNEAMEDERKLPCTDTRTLKIRYMQAVVGKFIWIRKQTNVSHASNASGQTLGYCTPQSVVLIFSMAPTPAACADEIVSVAAAVR